MRLATILIFAVVITVPASATDRSASRPAPYRFVGDPIVSYAGGALNVYVRLNRALPHAANGNLLGNAYVEDTGDDLQTWTTRESHCYEAPLDAGASNADALLHPRPGRRVTVRVRFIPGSPTVIGHARLKRVANAYDRRREFAKTLGCTARTYPGLG